MMRFNITFNVSYFRLVLDLHLLGQVFLGRPE